MTRSEKPCADNAGRGGPTEDPRSDGNPLSQAVASAAAEGDDAALSPNQDLRPKVQRIALVTMNCMDRAALCYALNACQRMDARLDILTNLSTEETNRAVMMARGAADTPWRVIRVDGKPSDAIIRYARNEPGLLFLVSGIGDETAARMKNISPSQGSPSGALWVEVANKRRRK